MTSTTTERHVLGALADDAGALARLVKSIVADELTRITGRRPSAATILAWNDDTTFDEDGLGVDSLMRLQIASRLDVAFHLSAVGVEDYLLLAPTLGEWLELLAEGLRRGSGIISFQTSGSTGAPKRVCHDAEALADEVRGYATVLGSAGRVISLVPPHHLYGFLFTVLSPIIDGREVIDLTTSPPSKLAALARRGDRIVATPFLWRLALTRGTAIAEDVSGVTSGGACPDDLFEEARACGLTRFVDIYGSTETAGLGWRSDGASGFAAMPHLEIVGHNPVRFRHRSGAAVAEPPDRLAMTGQGHFRPISRKDGVVQVAGRNVDPAEVRHTIAKHPEVVDCAVRLDRGGATSRLKAFVVPRAGARLDASDLSAWCDARLTASERPVRFSFGQEIPRNAMGKPTDWPD